MIKKTDNTSSQSISCQTVERLKRHKWIDLNKQIQILCDRLTDLQKTLSQQTGALLPDIRVTFVQVGQLCHFTYQGQTGTSPAAFWSLCHLDD